MPIIVSSSSLELHVCPECYVSLIYIAVFKSSIGIFHTVSTTKYSSVFAYSGVILSNRPCSFSQIEHIFCSDRSQSYLIRCRSPPLSYPVCTHPHPPSSSLGHAPSSLFLGNVCKKKKPSWCVCSVPRSVPTHG